MKKDNIIAALMTAAAFSILGYLIMKENPAPPLPPAAPFAQDFAQDFDSPPPLSVQQPRAGNPPRSETYYTPSQQRHANGLYKCIMAGRTIYQDQPCQEGRQATVSGTMSVVPRHPVEPYRQLVTKPAGPRVAMIEDDKPPPEDPRCPGLRQEIRNIDARARQRSHEWLTAERRRVGKLISALKCSNMD